MKAEAAVVDDLTERERVNDEEEGPYHRTLRPDWGRDGAGATNSETNGKGSLFRNDVPCVFTLERERSHVSMRIKQIWEGYIHIFRGPTISVAGLGGIKGKNYFDVIHLPLFVCKLTPQLCMFRRLESGFLCIILL